MPDLFLKQLVETTVAGIFADRIVPVGQQLFLFGLRGDLQLGDGGVGSCNHLLEEATEVGQHSFRRFTGEKIGGIFERRAQALGTVGEPEGQIELRGFLRQLQRLQFEVMKPSRRVGLVLEGKTNLEYRRHPKAALGVERLHELFKRDVIMRDGGEGCFLYATHRLAHRDTIFQAGAQGHGVDKKTDHGFQFDMLAVGDGGADDQISLIGITQQQDFPRRHDRVIEGGMLQTAEVAQTLYQGRGDQRMGLIAAVGLRWRARVIGR